MQFDKPKILPKHIPDIIKPYSLGKIVACENLGGIPNTTYKVVTDKHTFAVRIYSHGQSSLEHIKLELRVLEHLAKKNFPSPRPIRGKDGKLLQIWKGYHLLSTEFIEGDMAESVKITPDIAYGTGELAAKFKEVMKDFKADPVPEGETWLDRGDWVVGTIHEDLKERGWKMNLKNVTAQWERSSKPFRDKASELDSNIIHADFWPPNLKVKEKRIVGIMDFDDCCYGATIIDFSIALMELSMFEGTEMDKNLAKQLINGYFDAGGKITDLEKALIVDAIEMTCAVWLGFNIVQAPRYEQADVYLQRLNKLWDESYNRNLRKTILKLVNSYTTK